MTSAINSERQPAARIRDPQELARIARFLRRDVIELVAPTGQGYIQQGLGAADLFTVLYFAEMRLDPSDPDWPDRDRFLLSTAHNTAIFYATLAARGLVDPTAVNDYCKDGSPFEVNASERVGTPIEATLGSLGQGLSVGIGMALSARRHGSPSRVYVVLGDGELQEGQLWEAALLAGSLKLSNLCLIIDDNRMQVEGHIDKVVSVAPIAAKLSAFGWAAEEIDGHDIPALLAALDRARERDRPTCLVAATLAGKGVPSLEGVLAHNLKMPPEVAAEALAALADAEEAK
ncbi:transketolase [Neorhizobium galegae]|uniref:Transketolase, thiamine diphosphate binding domain protein n=1 Tax=Neorhizobium galegae bv. officinalis TaxID=323656 RepID=A0A0T7GKI7_NEOGA|nr:transketolase [Neorhizobium galegae]CDZ47810.1 Transketolase, thiamine diphosphate binding domain protein [Neorhizobium galegae bv. officinalis]